MNFYVDIYEKGENGENGKFIETVNLKSIIDVIIEFVKNLFAFEFAA